MARAKQTTRTKKRPDNRRSKGDDRGTVKVRSRMDAPEAATLTVYEAMFVNYFMGEAGFNRTKAAKMCGFLHAKEMGYQLLNRPAVKAAIKAKLNKAAMSVEELLIRLTEQASSSIEDCMSRGPNGWHLDLDKAKRLGKMHLIKKITPTAHGLSVEMYPADAAREQLMRYHGLFRDKLEVTQTTTTMKIDMSVLALSQEGLELLHRFSRGELDHEEFYAHARPLLEHSPSPTVIDGEGLVQEVPLEPDPVPPAAGSDG